MKILLCRDLRLNGICTVSLSAEKASEWNNARFRKFERLLHSAPKDGIGYMFILGRLFGTTLVSGDYIDGTYEGVGPGYNNKIKVQVTIEAGSITGIEILSQFEDEPYFSNALALVQDVLDQQTYDVDTVSGATTSSN